MSSLRAGKRLACAIAVGAAPFVACASAVPAATARSSDGWIQDTTQTVKQIEDAGSDAGPRCPYGALEDPHRGFVRCLLPEERDAGWLPPPPQGEAPPDSSSPPSDAGAAPPPAPPGALPVVEVGAPKFENGEVTKVEKSLGKAAGDLAKCVADHGGITGDVGSVKIQFLVRSRGRAEGVEVLAAKNVSAEAAACVRHAVKNRAIGAPSADPVGVNVIFTFRPSRP